MHAQVTVGARLDIDRAWSATKTAAEAHASAQAAIIRAETLCTQARAIRQAADSLRSEAWSTPLTGLTSPTVSRESVGPRRKPSTQRTRQL